MAAEPACPPVPPNLRCATDEGKECESCTYFARGHCTEYPPLVVDGEWVCDTYKSSTKGPASDEDAVSSQPRSLKAAGAQAREVMRAAKK